MQAEDGAIHSFTTARQDGLCRLSALKTVLQPVPNPGTLESQLVLGSSFPTPPCLFVPAITASPRVLAVALGICDCWVPPSCSLDLSEQLPFLDRRGKCIPQCDFPPPGSEWFGSFEVGLKESHYE